jgi:hypothetical protein
MLRLEIFGAKDENLKRCVNFVKYSAGYKVFIRLLFNSFCKFGSSAKSLIFLHFYLPHNSKFYIFALRLPKFNPKTVQNYFFTPTIFQLVEESVRRQRQTDHIALGG